MAKASAAAARDEADKRELLRRKKEIDERVYAESLEKKARYRTVKRWEKEHTDYLRTLNTYATDVDDKTLRRIRGDRDATVENMKKARVDGETYSLLERTGNLTLGAGGSSSSPSSSS